MVQIITPHYFTTKTLKKMIFKIKSNNSDFTISFFSTTAMRYSILCRSTAFAVFTFNTSRSTKATTFWLFNVVA